MTWNQHLTNHITLSKKLVPFMNFFHLRILPLILYRAIIREKEPPILRFLNLYLTFNKIHGSIWQLTFESQSLSCKLSFFLPDFNLFEKKSLKWNCFFFLKSSNFWAITPVFWRICLQTDLQFQIPNLENIYDRHSSKIPD